MRRRVLLLAVLLVVGCQAPQAPPVVRAVEHFAVDRIEGDVAVLENDAETIIIPVDSLPVGAVEGSVITTFPGHGISEGWLDHIEATRRLEGARVILDSLKRRK
jgi:hypothetical protein